MPWTGWGNPAILVSCGKAEKKAGKRTVKTSGTTMRGRRTPLVRERTLTSFWTIARMARQFIRFISDGLRGTRVKRKIDVFESWFVVIDTINTDAFCHHRCHGIRDL